MKTYERKLPLLLVLLLLAVFGGVVYAVTMYTITVPSSLTVGTVGELAVTDLDNNALPSLDFGTVAPGASVSKTLRIKNTSNMVLYIVIQCDVGMFWEVHDHNGLEVEHRAPLLGGDLLQITITITPTLEANAGTHNFNLVITGEN